MSRIRTIKPEFPQSETIGRLSRDARLLFVQLWTIADDSGKARAASRMLASLLYPYDDDAPSLIEGWLAELEREGCIRRYEVEGSTYLEILNWLKHQRIDKPSKSKIPPFAEPSRTLANPREESATDLGPRTSTIGPSTEDAAPSEAAFDPSAEERDYFVRGKQVCGKDSGGLLTNLLKTRGKKTALARSVVELAATKENPREYVAAAIRGPPAPNTDRPWRPPDV